MNRTLKLRYALFSLVFLFVIIGFSVHSYPLLVGAVIVAIILGVLGDRIENAPTKPFKENNELHHRRH